MGFGLRPINDEEWKEIEADKTKVCKRCNKDGDWLIGSDFICSKCRKPHWEETVKIEDLNYEIDILDKRIEYLRTYMEMDIEYKKEYPKVRDRLQYLIVLRDKR